MVSLSQIIEKEKQKSNLKYKARKHFKEAYYRLQDDCKGEMITPLFIEKYKFMINSLLIQFKTFYNLDFRLPNSSLYIGKNTIMTEYNVNISIYVLGYEKLFTIPVIAPDEMTAQKIVLEDELHNAHPSDITTQKDNPELLEVDDIDFIYKVNWVKKTY